MANPCGRTDRGPWECRPAGCTRWPANCPETLIWNLYKPAPKEEPLDDENSPET